MKKDCDHIQVKNKEHEREFQREKFSFKAPTCQECGAILWNNDLEKKFNGWLEILYSEKRHLFQVQFNLTEIAVKCIQKLNERFPGVDDSLLMRAIVMVYLDVVEPKEEILEKIESLLETSDYQNLSTGDKFSKKIQFNPGGMKDILSYSDMFKLKPNKIIEESIYRTLLLFVNEDHDLKEFWNKIILKNIETILKAA